MSAAEKPSDLRDILANALDVVSDGVIVSDSRQQVLFFNRGAERIFGHSAEEIVGQSLDLLMLPGLAPSHQVHLRAFAASEEAARPMGRTGRVRGVRKDGTDFPAEATIYRLGREERPLLMVIIRDITERTEAETALMEKEALLRQILEILPVGVWILGRDGQVLSANQAGRTLWAGVRYVGMEEYHQYKAWWPSTGRPVRPEEWAAARTITRGDTILDEVVDIETFDGRRRTILNSSLPIRDASGALTGAIVLNQDVTERELAYQLLEQRVEERTRELSALLEVSRNVASQLDLAPLLQAILAQLKTVVDYTGAGIAILQDDSILRMLDYVGPIPREQMLVAIPLMRDSGYREVAQCLEPFIIDDVWANTPYMQEVRQEWKDEMSVVSEVRSWLGVPLIAMGRLIGVLRLDHAEPGHFTREHARLALAFADAAAVAIENARLYEQAQGTAALEERQRLARDLHDSVSQALYGMTLGARTARALVQQDPTRAVEALDYVLSLAEAAFAEMRAVIFDLRPDSVEQEGLVAALGWQADLLRIRYQLEVETHFCDEPDLPLSVKEALYGIARETVNNIVKHAGARRVILRLDHRPGDTSLEIVDDGVGFETAEAHPGHLGLRSIQERAEAVGAAIEIESRAGAGTRIRVQIA